MNQSSSRLFDDLGRLMTDAAGVADGVRREVETVAKSQMERALATMDLPTQDDIEALKELIASLHEQNKALETRVAALEAEKGGSSESKT